MRLSEGCGDTVSSVWGGCPGRVVRQSGGSGKPV